MITGVQTARQAITHLQLSQAETEDKLAVAITDKLQIEEALKAGVELISSTSSGRMVAPHLLDVCRKALMSVTSSMECYIILPRDEAGLFDLEQGVGTSTAIGGTGGAGKGGVGEGRRGAIGEAVDGKREPSIAAPIDSASNPLLVNLGQDEGSQPYCTLTADHPQPVAVRFQAGDIEAGSLYRYGIVWYGMV